MAEVQSSPEGLTQQEAAKRLENGLNQLKEAPKKSSFALFLDTFKDAMVIVLLIVAIIQMVMVPTLSRSLFFAVLLLNSSSV